jgi:GST-like protein
MRIRSEFAQQGPVMKLIFYYAPMSSASPVASALIELGVAHERVTFDLSKQDHKRPEYLAINPNGAVPALVIDGTPMFEATAIMQWLGHTFGVAKGLWPAEGDPQRLEAASWCTWAYVTYGQQLVRLHYATSERFDPSLRSEVHAKSATEQLDALLQILEDRLCRQPYMLGAKYSLVDLVVASVIGYSVYVGAPVSKHKKVSAWLRDFQSREAYTAVVQSS